MWHTCFRQRYFFIFIIGTNKFVTSSQGIIAYTDILYIIQVVGISFSRNRFTEHKRKRRSMNVRKRI